MTRIADLEVIDALSAQSEAYPGSGEPNDTPADLLPVDIVTAEAKPDVAPARIDERKVEP